MALCLLILLAGSTLHMLGGSPNGWGVDDAFIPFRYARNLSEGKGLVFNPGERVEGYTDFLYVVLMAPAYWTTDNDGIYFYSFFLNLGCAAVAFLLLVLGLNRRLDEPSALAGALLFALCLPLWVAVTWGLETPLVLAIAIGMWLAVEEVADEPTSRAISVLCVAMVLSLLARADGFIIVGVALVYLIVKRRFRALAICTGVVFTAATIYEGWRFAYYGYPLPNTYYVKVAGPLWPRIIHAYGQLSSIAVFEGLLPFLVIIPFAWAAAIGKGKEGFGKLAEGIRFDLIFPLAWLVYWFYIGGDYYWDRFLIILYPLGIFALLKFLAGNARGKVLAFVAVVLAAIEVTCPLKMDGRFDYQFNKYDGLIVAGKFLGKNFPGKTLATGAIGKIPFFSNLYTEDMLGLADPVIAHHSVAARDFEPGELKYDADYTLGRRPDLIANWISSSLDTSYGLTRAKYQKAGYRIGYLVNMGKTPPAQSIVSVEGLTDGTIQQWIAEGYSFAILVRE